MVVNYQKLTLKSFKNKNKLIIKKIIFQNGN